jgi:CRISPR-associated protein (TIGR03986 family)
MITAPFNFVPLSEKVFFPDWAEKVSHDIPFEDSQSGSIDITITAKSPIFIRDHEKQEEFCQHNGEYYIPSSSVKGMVRNVLEIMSFSKMSIYNDDTYAVRDLRNRELYMSKMTPDNTFCGWLKKSEDGKSYLIEDCGKVGRIKHEEIDKIYHMNFASKFKHGTFGNKAKDKTAKVKYEIIGEDKSFEHNFSYFKKDVNREIYLYHEHGKSKGTLVLTGQPSARNEPQGRKPSGKVYEFIFFEKKDELKVSEKTVENFFFAYFDKRTTEPKESPDWTYWKKKLENDEKVPVFFQKNGKEVLHFGLSYLYKLPYANSVSGGIPATHTDNRKDLAETLFGYIGDNEALKGRVQFSHFKAVENAQPLKEVREILGTPRASYYPMYVKQNGKLFTTFMDNGFSISGRKRYPIHKSGVKKTEDTGNENVGTTFTPLKEGIVFKGKLRYHNLKKVELGALLSALTFHNTQGCFHNIGMAKSLGYGKIELELKHENLEGLLKIFETEVTSNIPNWSESEQLTELLTMATEQDNSSNSKLKYMELKEFASNKTGDKDYLRNYTELDNIKSVSVQSLISEADLEELKELQSQKEKALKEQEEKKKQELLFTVELNVVLGEFEKEDGNLQVVQNFINKYHNYEKIDEIKSKKEKIEKAKKDDRYKEVNEKFDRAYEALQKKKGNQKQYSKEKDKFVKKWSKEKENKGSSYILEIVEKLK